MLLSCECTSLTPEQCLTFSNKTAFFSICTEVLKIWFQMGKNSTENLVFMLAVFQAQNNIEKLMIMHAYKTAVCGTVIEYTVVLPWQFDPHV